MATNRLVEKGKVEAYTNMLFDAANEAGGKEGVVEVRNQLSDVMSLIFKDMDVMYSLSSPDYTPEQRHELAKAAFSQCNPVLSETLAVMAEREDMDLLSRVFHDLEDEMNDKLGLCVVDVVTVVPLDDALRTQIKDKVNTDLGLESVLKESIDKSILGGIIMSVNGMRIDASVSSQLNRARHTLKQTDGGES